MHQNSNSRYSSPILLSLMIVYFALSLLRQPVVTFSEGNERRLWIITREAPEGLGKIRDQDGDGIPEIIIGCNGGVLAVDGRDGEIIWEVDTIQNIHVVRIISKDDSDYVVARHSLPNEQQQLGLSMLSAGNGKVRWSNAVGLSGWPGLNTIVVPDLDGDGWSDVCMGSTSIIETSGQVTLFSGSTGSIIWVVNTSYPFVGQLISVGPSNLAVVSKDTLSGRGALFLINGSDGKVIWRTNVEDPRDVVYPKSSDRLIMTRLLAGNRENVSAVDLADGKILWEVPFGKIWNLFPLPDLDGDGRGDALVNVWEDGGPIVALSSATGSTIWATDIPKYRPEPVTLAGDVNGDGVPDILVGTGGGLGIVYLLSGINGKILWAFSASSHVQSDIYDVLAPGDLDGDGQPDVVASSYDNNIYALSLRDISSAIDNEPPIISNVTISPNTPTINEVVKISASIEDELSSVIEASISYSSDSGSTWLEATMTLMLNNTTYQGTIPTQASNVVVQFYIKVMDTWGNAAMSPTQEYTIATQGYTFPILLYGIPVAVVLILVIVIYLRKSRSPP